MGEEVKIQISERDINITGITREFHPYVLNPTVVQFTLFGEITCSVSLNGDVRFDDVKKRILQILKSIK